LHIFGKAYRFDRDPESGKQVFYFPDEPWPVMPLYIDNSGAAALQKFFLKDIEPDKNKENETSRGNTEWQIAGTDCQANYGGCPEACGGSQALNARAVAKNSAGTEKADPRDYLRAILSGSPLVATV